MLMMKRKFMAALLLVAMVLCCSACSNDLVSFMQVSREMAAMGKVQQTADLTVDFEVSDEVKAELPEGLSTLKINLTTESDNEKLQAKMAVKVTAGDITLPMTMYVDKTRLYFNTADVMAIYQMIEPNNAEGLAQLKTIVGDSEWLCWSIIDEQLWEDMALINGTVDSYYDEINNLLVALKDAYSGFDSKLLTKRGNTYTIELNNRNVIDCIDRFMQYSTKNADKIADSLLKWVNNSSLFDDAYKLELKATIENAAIELKALAGADLAALTGLNEGAASLPFDCNVEYALTRNSAKSFDVKYTVNYKSKEPTDDVLAYKMVGTAQTKGVSNIDFVIPTAKVLDVYAIDKTQFAPKSVNATIYLDDDYMYYHQYFALPGLDESSWVTPDVRIINNTTYLGLRPVAEACGEEVGWDSAKKSPYVVRDGQKTYVAGYVDANVGRSYLKIRDFEKLGYSVNYQKDDILGQVVDLSR